MIDKNNLKTSQIKDAINALKKIRALYNLIKYLKTD